MYTVIQIQNTKPCTVETKKFAVSKIIIMLGQKYSNTIVGL